MLIISPLVGCAGPVPHELAPTPEIGVVHTPVRRCTGTRIGDGEVLTAASCIAGARAAELAYAPAGSPDEQDVSWVVYGSDPDVESRGDWAILSLRADTAEAAHIGARHLGFDAPEFPSSGSQVWWAGASTLEGRVIGGLCSIVGEIWISSSFDIHVVEHDCRLQDVRPGVLLYELEEDAPRAVAFQGLGTGAINVAEFSDAPVPASDVISTRESFVGTEAEVLYALDGRGILTHRMHLEGRWLPWIELSQAPRPMLRMDGTPASLAFRGERLQRIWTIDDNGQLHAYSVLNDTWHTADAPEGLVDVSVARDGDERGRLFVLSSGGQLCTRLDVLDSDTPWLCVDIAAGAQGLDAMPLESGFLVVTAHPERPEYTLFRDEGWQAAEPFGDNGGYQTLTVNITQTGIPYAIASGANELRIRIGNADASIWSDWAPLFGTTFEGHLSLLETGRGALQPDTLYSIIDGEVRVTSGLSEANIESAQSDPTRAVQFSGWRRLDGLHSL